MTLRAAYMRITQETSEDHLTFLSTFQKTVIHWLKALGIKYISLYQIVGINVKRGLNVTNVIPQLKGYIIQTNTKEFSVM